jgi:uncharacterized membrane protein YfcA
MKFAIQCTLIALGTLVLELFLPWWSLAIVAFACGYFLKSNQNFLAGFLGVAIIWIGYAFLLDSNSVAPLAERVSAILTIKKPLLFLVTGFLGGLVGGFAALTGSLLKSNKRKSLYY